MPSIEEAWNMPISAEMSSRQQLQQQLPGGAGYKYSGTPSGPPPPYPQGQGHTAKRFKVNLKKSLLNLNKKSKVCRTFLEWKCKMLVCCLAGRRTASADCTSETAAVLLDATTATDVTIFATKSWKFDAPATGIAGSAAASVPIDAAAPATVTVAATTSDPTRVTTGPAWLPHGFRADSVRPTGHN